MACALQGGILPPVEVYWELAKDEAQPGFEKHTRGYLLHNTKPIEAMTEEQAIEYLIMKDIPQRVWRTWDEGNKPKMVICRLHQLPEHRQWRNAWQIREDIELAIGDNMTSFIVDKDGNQIDASTVTSKPSD